MFKSKQKDAHRKYKEKWETCKNNINEIDLRIVEYTSQRIPPVQYINISVFSLSTAAKGSEAMTCS